MAIINAENVSLLTAAIPEQTPSTGFRLHCLTPMIIICFHLLTSTFHSGSLPFLMFFLIKDNSYCHKKQPLICFSFYSIPGPTASTVESGPPGPMPESTSSSGSKSPGKTGAVVSLGFVTPGPISCGFPAESSCFGRDEA